MLLARVDFCVIMTTFIVLATPTSTIPGAAVEDIRFVFARTLCQDHLKSKSAKMIERSIGDKLCTKPIYCYDPERGVSKAKLPDTPRDGLICKLAFRAEGRIPYICRKGRCIEAPEYRDRLTFGLIL